MSGIVQSHDVSDDRLATDEQNPSSFHFQNFKRLGRLFGDMGSVVLSVGPNRKLKLTPVTPGSVSFSGIGSIPDHRKKVRLILRAGDAQGWAIGVAK